MSGGNLNRTWILGKEERIHGERSPGRVFQSYTGNARSNQHACSRERAVQG